MRATSRCARRRTGLSRRTPRARFRALATNLVQTLEQAGQGPPQNRLPVRAGRNPPSEQQVRRSRPGTERLHATARTPPLGEQADRCRPPNSTTPRSHLPAQTGPDRLSKPRIEQNQPPTQPTPPRRLPTRATSPDRSPERQAEHNRPPTQTTPRSYLPARATGPDQLPERRTEQNRPSTQPTPQSGLPTQATSPSQSQNQRTEQIPPPKKPTPRNRSPTTNQAERKQTTSPKRQPPKPPVERHCPAEQQRPAGPPARRTSAVRLPRQAGLGVPLRHGPRGTRPRRTWRPSSCSGGPGRVPRCFPHPGTGRRAPTGIERLFDLFPE